MYVYINCKCDLQNTTTPPTGGGGEAKELQSIIEMTSSRYTIRNQVASGTVAGSGSTRPWAAASAACASS
jgi:hypothetical protein